MELEDAINSSTDSKSIPINRNSYIRIRFFITCIPQPIVMTLYRRSLNTAKPVS